MNATVKSNPKSNQAKVTQWTGPDTTARAAMREKRVLVCLSADARFWSMLDECLASLQDIKLPPSWSIGIVDAGMLPQQLDALKSAGIAVVPAGWHLSVPMPAHTPGWFQGVSARPFIPKLFPGYDIYIQMDADACMLDLEGLLDMAAAASDGKSCVIIFEHFSPGGVKVPVKLPNGQMVEANLSEGSIRRAVERCYVANYGPDYAWCAAEFICNTGMLAMTAACPYWDIWGDYLSSALVSAPIHKLIEQQALNLAMLDGTVPVTQMPNTYNWNIATRLPTWRPATPTTPSALIDPATGDAIHMFHLTDLKHLFFFDIPQLHATTSFFLPLRYRKIRAALSKPAAST